MFLLISVPYLASVYNVRLLCEACLPKGHLSKLPYFSLRKPHIRTFYTASSQNVDFMDRHYLSLFVHSNHMIFSTSPHLLCRLVERIFLPCNK